MNAKQNPTELQWLAEKIKGCHSILEVGSYDGDTLHFLAESTKIRPQDMWVGSLDKHGGKALCNKIEVLKKLGFMAELYHGDSTSLEAVKWVREKSPIDFIFLDGGHGGDVLRDWANFRDCARIIGFHDICHPRHLVKPLWEKLKAEGFRTEEIKTSADMGIGIVYMREAI